AQSEPGPGPLAHRLGGDPAGAMDLYVASFERARGNRDTVEVQREPVVAAGLSVVAHRGHEMTGVGRTGEYATSFLAQLRVDARAPERLVGPDPRFRCLIAVHQMPP